MDQFHAVHNEKTVRRVYTGAADKSTNQKFGRKQLNEEKSSNGLLKKPKLGNAGKLRGICSLVRKSFKLRMESAMPCKVQNHQCRESCGKESDSRRSKYSCIVEAHESTRKRSERTLPKIMKNPLQRMGFNS